jgi:hypothetical protein
MKFRYALVLCLTPALALASTAFGRASAPPRLKGVVGPGFTISLKKGGKKVTKLKAGRYTFVIADRSSFHDFTLEQEKGGKFEKHLTKVPSTGTVMKTVVLKKGKWKYYCSAHEDQMHGFFTVT